MTITCYCCGRVIKGKRFPVYLSDDNFQKQFVGPDCFKRIKAAGTKGYETDECFPRMWAMKPTWLTV